jgi:hypothetical protein
MRSRFWTLTPASGENLLAPALQLTTPVVVQLLVDDGLMSQCWQATYSQIPKKNGPTKFKATQ